MTFNNIPISDWYISISAISIIAIFILTVEIGIKYFKFSFLYTRKFIHIGRIGIPFIRILCYFE